MLDRDTGRTIYSLAVITAAVISAPAQSASAQNVSASGLATAPQDGALEEIIVTAQRRSENLQKVPIAVTAVTGQQLVASGIVNTMQLGAVVAGISTRSVSGSFQPFLRGVGTATNLVENPVALYVDGVYYPVQREGARDLVDLQQIAVLKGPQGTLFGRNATGGVIQITTRDPRTDGAELELSQGIDTYLTWRNTLYGSTPIGDNIAANFSASYTKQGEGWGRNVTRDEETSKIFHDLALRSKVVFEPDSKFKATLIADYGDTHHNLNTFRPVEGTRPQFSSPTFVPPGDPRDTPNGGPSFFKMKSGGISANVTYDLDFAKLVSITAFRKGKSTSVFDPVGNPFLTQVNYSDQRFNSLSQELQLVSAQSGRLKWTIGLFYFRFRDNVAFNPHYYGPASPLPTSNNILFFKSNELVKSVAGYAQATYEIIDGTKITGGLRYTYEDRDFLGSKTSLSNAGVINPLFAPPVDASIKAKRLTWRLSVDQQLTPDALAYVSYNRGFKSGGFNLQDPNNPPYEPETIDAFEAGLKSELFDRHVRLNISGFYYKYKNVQVATFTTNPIITNGAAARIYGAEAEAQANVTANLRFNASLSLLHARFSDFPNAQCSVPLPTGGARLVTCSAKGHRLPFSQPFVFQTGVDYDVDTSLGNMAFNVSNSYNKGYFTESDNRLYQPSFDTLNASTTLTLPNERVSLRLFVQNLFNEDVASIKISTGVRGYIESYGSPPRTIGASLKVKL